MAQNRKVLIICTAFDETSFYNLEVTDEELAKLRRVHGKMDEFLDDPDSELAGLFAWANDFLAKRESIYDTNRRKHRVFLDKETEVIHVRL